MFIIPFIIMGLFLAIKMWQELPEATRKYLVSVEKVSLTVGGTKATVETVKVIET